MREGIEVYLDQWHIDQADEERRLYPRSFRPSMQCPIARAIADHLQVDGVEVGEGSYHDPLHEDGVLGSHDAGGIIQEWDYGGGTKPQWFHIWPS